MVDCSRLHHDVPHPLRNLVLGRVVFAGRKGYSLVDAGFAMLTYPIAGLAGAILSGIISDKLFKGSCICDYSDAMVDRYLRTLIIRGNFYYH